MSDIDKCSYADKYKAIHRPKCKCLACRDKYIDKLVERVEAQDKAAVRVMQLAAATDRVTARLQAENKRLRDALEKIADGDDIIGAVDKLSYRKHIAKQALDKDK